MHKTVFQGRAVEALNLKEGDIVIDATFGGGGHSREILGRIGKDGALIAIDKDPDAIARAHELKKTFFNIFPVHIDFRNLDKAVEEAGFQRVNAILFDFGISQNQLDESGRGFSFKRNEKLDMRMNPEDTLTAEYIINSYPEDEIRNIIQTFGEDYRARKIARTIVQERQKSRIATTFDLAEIIFKVSKPRERFRRIHPATKTFQALRIVVNSELAAIEEALRKALTVLESGGRCVAISFHSLEDRIVKHFLKRQAKETKTIRILTKKPLVVSEKEKKENPRARSAKMRVVEKLSVLGEAS